MKITKFYIPLTISLVYQILSVSTLNAQKSLSDTETKTLSGTIDTTTQHKKYWSNKLNLSVSIDQTSRNKNWQKGGDPFFISLLANFFLVNQYHHPKYFMINDVYARLGISFETSESKFEETDDYLAFYNTIGYKLNKNYGIGYLNGIQSQFNNYFMTPGYIKTGPVFFYNYRKNTHITISPIMSAFNTKFSKEYFNMDKYGVDSGKKISYNFGAFLQLNTIIPLSDKGLYKGTLTVFNDYLSRDKKTYIDWINVFKYDFNDYLGLLINVHFRYSEFEVYGLQFAQSTGIGISYSID